MKPIPIKKEPLGKYAVAPYNFVSFPAKAQIRYNDFSELPKHNSYKDKDGKKLLNGHIAYRLKAETPIMVSSGIDKDKQANFFKNSKGEYAIQGNTIRGMIRTNVQILSHSSIVGNRSKKGEYEDSDIEGSTFLFRDVAGNNSLGKKYSTLLGIDSVKRIAKKVKAGYMVNEGGKLRIEPAEELIESQTYFRIDEIELRKRADKKLPGIYFMYKEGLFKGKDGILNGRVNDESSDPYKPYQAKISFEYDKKSGKVIQIGAPSVYKNDGYILSGGFIRGKLSHYIVPKAKDDVKAIDISDKQKEGYLDDLVLTKKAKKTSEGVKINKDKEFWALPEIGCSKPVFYINFNNELHFGFTPYLRVSYGKSVLDGIKPGYKDVQGISYADGIFGFSNREAKGIEKKISYKSRVSFEDAVAIGKAEVDEDSSIEMILAEPKPTSYNLYLVQENEKQLSIYDGDFRLRGIKQYWLKEYIEKPPKTNSTEMTFHINPLKEGTCFEGKIYFSNLYEDELGLLLWALRLDEGCRQNIGLAKPYGFGRVEVYDIELQIEDIDKKYDSFCFDYMFKADIDGYIDVFKKYFSKEKLNGKDIDEEKPIIELMHIKSKIVKLEEANNYRDMEIKPENEFAKKRILPEISKCDSSYTADKAFRGQFHYQNGKSYIDKVPQNNQNMKNKKKEINAGRAKFNDALSEQLKIWQKENEKN